MLRYKHRQIEMMQQPKLYTVTRQLDDCQLIIELSTQEVEQIVRQYTDSLPVVKAHEAQLAAERLSAERTPKPAVKANAPAQKTEAQDQPKATRRPPVAGRLKGRVGEILEMYGRGDSMAAIARHFGVAEGTIRYHLRKFNIPTRNSAEVAKLAKRRAIITQARNKTIC